MIMSLSHPSTNANTLLLLTTVVAVASGDKTVITLGQYVDYPPYATQTPEGEIAGFGKDFADAMTALCDDVEVNMVYEQWKNCWIDDDGGMVGESVSNGTLDGCATYTHTAGVRDDKADFSDAILQDNQAAGLLTLLNEDGLPKVSGMEDLSGRKIIDVGGWAPTADGLGFVTNQCTNEKYSKDLTLLMAEGEVANDVAMQMLRDGEGDAIFIYANQAEEYTKCPEGSAWNCTLWEGFGTDYAYVQTGQFGYAINGTTLSLSNKGSGIREKLRPCMSKVMGTKEYYEICEKHGVTKVCYPNSFFPEDAVAMAVTDIPTREQTGDCSNGYCPCEAGAAEGAVEDTSVLDKVKDKGEEVMEEVKDKGEEVMEDIKDTLGGILGGDASEEDTGAEEPEPSLCTRAVAALGVGLLSAMAGAQLA